MCAPKTGQRRHVMLSGRFNNEKIVEYIKKVNNSLQQNEKIPTFMVESQTGEEFASPTRFGLYHAKAMVVFGTDQYGARTGARYETFYELQYAHEHNLHLIPLQLCKKWPPEPKDSDGGEAGKIQNDYVLSRSHIRLVDQEMMKPEEMAKKIADAVRGFDRTDKARAASC